MTRTVPKASYSNGQDTLENFDKLATYAVNGAKKAKRRVLGSGLIVTVIKNGHVIQVNPDGHEETIRDVNTVRRFKPLQVS